MNVKNFHGLFCALIVGACSASFSSRAQQPSTNLSYTIETLPAYDRLFYREAGWTGGDVANSLPLRDGRILWLFGDSWIGTICQGRHTNSTMIHNAIAIQRGIDPASAHVNFFYGNDHAKPAPFIHAADKVGYFWPTHGAIQTDRTLYLFLSRIINRPGDNSVWAFRSSGIVMAKITNASAEPADWKIEQTNVPFAKYEDNGSERAFGLPLIRDGGYIYIYGLEYNRPKANRYLLAARVKESALENFSAWEFYAAGQWQSDFLKATPLADHLGAELSISFLPRFQRYVMIYTENGLSEKIMLRTSPTPIGPWSEPAVIYHTPEMSWDKTYFCYAAKAHPELSQASDELMLSYVCNSSDFGKMAGDTRIYFPKFLRIKFAIVQ